MLKNKEIPADRKPMSAEEVILALKKLAEEDKDCKIKNPFTSGLNFENGEKVTFVGFSYSDWEDDGVGVYSNGRKHEKAHGSYPVLVLKSVATGAIKNLSISVLTKQQTGILLDAETNPENLRGMWTNKQGLAEVAKSCSGLNKDDFLKLSNWLGTAEHTMSVKWIEVAPRQHTSLVNIL